MIEFKHLRKEFNVPQKQPGLWGSLKSLVNPQFTTKRALNDVSCKIGAGEIVGLVGANGAGKTTLVKILSGIVVPSAGDVNVLGFNPWDRQDEFKRQIALILGQKAQLWWDLPALDCFDLLREIYDVDKTEFKKNLKVLVEMLGVGDHLTTQIRRLSLGERMKMELIAALLHKPRVVFLDEPTIGLDFTSQKAIRKFLLEYSKEHKPAMILTSHYIEDIKSLCERVVVMRSGQFVYDGLLSDVSVGFEKKRVIKVRYKSDSMSQLRGPLFEKTGVRILESSSDEIKVESTAENIKDVVRQMFEQFDVLDVAIEDEDIAQSIESIMRNQKSHLS